MLVKPRSDLLVVAVAALFGLGAGAVFFFLVVKSPEMSVNVYEPTVSSTVDRAMIGQKRPAFELKDIDGKTRHVREWDGKYLVINFWATWCPPCRHEVPFFVDLQSRYGPQNLRFLGIAIDQPELVRKFASDLDINYPLLHGQLDAIEVGKAYGNSAGALPYTVLIGSTGRILSTKVGAFEADEIETVIRNAFLFDK